MLGAQNFPGRGGSIRHEWRLNTPEKFKAGDPSLYALLTDAQYKIPTRLPDGRYRPEKHAEIVIDPEVTQLFDEHDTNEDGELNVDEVPAEGKSDFAHIDADGSGGITPEELQAFFEEQN